MPTVSALMKAVYRSDPPTTVRATGRRWLAGAGVNVCFGGAGAGAWHLMCGYSTTRIGIPVTVIDPLHAVVVPSSLRQVVA